MHNHAAPPASAPAFNLNDNVIAGNYVARNHADTQDAATSGPTGINVYGAGAISGTVIAQNVIRDETIDVATHTPGDVLVHLNALEGAHAAGVSNTGQGSVNATENWWGCPEGPGHGGCSSVEGSGISVSPWLTQPDTAMGGSDR